MAQNVVSKLGDITSAITTFVTNNGATVARFAKIVTGVSLALGGIGAIATFAGFAVTALGTVLGAVGTIISAVGMLAGFVVTPLGILTIAIGIATAGFVKFLLQSQSLRAFLSGPFVGSLESVASGLEAVVEALAAGAASEFLPSDDKSSSAGDAIGYLADLDLRREQLKTQLSNLGRDFGLNADGPSPEKANFLQIAQDAGKAAGMLVGSQIVADLPTELTLPEIDRWNAAGNEMFSDLVANLGNAPDLVTAGGSGPQYSAMTAMEKGSIDAAKMAIEIMMRGEGQDDEAREKRKIDLLQNIDKNLQQPPVNLHIA